MVDKHILVVDDDKSILRMLEFGLRKLGASYKISTAKDMSSALEEIEKQHFDLVLTDYMMPGMTGIDLARAVHSISPTTQVILMTAYGTNKLKDTSTHIGFDGYLDKPFDIDDVRELVQTKAKEAPPVRKSIENLEPAVAQAGSNEKARKKRAKSASKSPSVPGLLDNLLSNAGARAVLLINTSGDPLKSAGHIDPKRATDIAARVAANFLHTADLSTLLENKGMFKSGFYEGDSYNMYVCDVNSVSLLVVIFDAKLRPGVVWFYTKQIASELAPLLV
jgi:CheY-like chemotaxis protein